MDILSYWWALFLMGANHGEERTAAGGAVGEYMLEGGVREEWRHVGRNGRGRGLG